MMIDEETILFWKIDNNPLDEAARVKYEELIRSKSLDSREVRFIDLEHQLIAAVEKPSRFASLRLSLEKLHRKEFNWDDRGWICVMQRRFDLWLDRYHPALSLAVENYLRLFCGIEPTGSVTQTPLVIRWRISSLSCTLSHIHNFICRYERRSKEEVEMSSDEIVLTFRPAWNTDG